MGCPIGWGSGHSFACERPRHCDHDLVHLPRGRGAAAAIQASAKQPAVFGKALAALAIVESFALFAFVFALLLL